MALFKLNIVQKSLISESDFGKPQKWETYSYLSKFKFSELFVNTLNDML